MSNLLFKRWNDFGGWLVFLIAAFVYGMTIEPTASFWDCPEFISCAEKLQVGHPPGAPFYMLVGNLFTQFASDASQVSGMVNFLNALLSAGCILFLFWSITRLVRALLVGDERKLSVMDVIIILGAGFVGALAYTFSDTFWFSAVEGEVYAFSSFLTALVFWMILRWQDESDSVSGDRWIILIAYIIGLSIGVHLLNLLCIPAIVLVFYYQKYQTLSLKGVIGAIALSGILIVLILFVYIPGMADVGGWFELFFVNVMGLPFQSGLIVFLGLVLFLLIGAIYRFRKRIVNTGLWCLLMLTIGYTTYAVILIRAKANTPLNMWNDRSAASYKGWSGGGANEAPTQKENLTYFITYQLNYMYWRYFLWNFVGRQNDIQGSGEPEHGNWITGISWLDNLRLGDQKLLPESLRENKGHNVFYGLPLLLGLLGIYWQWTRGKKGKQQFSVLFFLFFMTGLAIVLYLNQTPGQPRERGDNDTFPLWYNQDTEEVRRDVRICNLSYAQTDWYIYQQQCPLYDAPGLPISWDQNQYQEGKNEYVAVRPELKKQIEALYQKHPEEARDSFGNDPYEIKNILKYWVFAEKQEFHVIPTDTINIYIDKDAVLRSGMMLPEAIRHLKGEELRDAIPDKLSISLKNIRLLTKVDLLMLEILANCNWERPLYMAISVGNSSKLKFDDYFVQEGLAFRFTPFNYKEWGDVEEGNGYAIDTEKLYENVMNRYKYGGLDTPGLYLDETTLRICYSHRRLFAQLAKELVKQGDDIRARKVLEYAGQTIPAYNVPEVYESGSYDIATAYASIGETQKATDLLNHLIAESENYIDWAFSLGDNRIGMVQQDCLYRFWQWNQCNELLKSMDKKRYEQSNQQFEKKYMRFTQLMNYHN